jgi:hypothetical protein
MASPGLLVKRSPISAFLVGRYALLELRQLRDGLAIAAHVVPCGALSLSGAVGAVGRCRCRALSLSGA